jgi:hypothetical protein
MDEAAARNAAEAVDRMASRLEAAEITGAVGARCHTEAVSWFTGVRRSDRRLTFALGFCWAVLMVGVACSTTEVSTASTPKPPSFQVVSTDWRITEDHSAPDCVPSRYTYCPPSSPVYSYTPHGIFKNVGGVRGSGLVTFYGWLSKDRHECTAVIPETAPGSVTEASCSIRELSGLTATDSVGGSQQSGGSAPGYKLG